MPSIQQQRRIEKAINERFFLLDVVRDDDVQWKLSGSKFDVYTITVSRSRGRITCDCPDSFSHARRHGCLCKHCCFVILKVLKYADFNIFSTHVVSRPILNMLLTCDSECLRDPQNENGLLSQRYQHLKGHPDTSEADISFETVRGCEDECSICYCPLTADGTIRCVCPECHNMFHKDCIKRWLHTSTSCPLCRSTIWQGYVTPKPDPAKQYMNLLS